MGNHRRRVYKYTNDDLAKLFKVSKATLKRWEDLGSLDRGDIGSILRLWVNLKSWEIG